MNKYELFRQAASMRTSLLQWGYLDEQFIQLEELQDEENPDFVEEVVNIYFTDSARIIHNIEQALERSPHDFEKLDDCILQLKSSCSSIGAKTLTYECGMFKVFRNGGYVEGYMQSFQTIKQHHAALKEKLQTYFQLVRQARAAGDF